MVLIKARVQISNQYLLRLQAMVHIMESKQQTKPIAHLIVLNANYMRQTAKQIYLQTLQKLCMTCQPVVKLINLLKQFLKIR